MGFRTGILLNLVQLTLEGVEFLQGCIYLLQRCLIAIQAGLKLGKSFLVEVVLAFQGQQPGLKLF